MADTKQVFHWADYLLFGISLAVGIIVGVVMAVKEKWHKQSSESYLMGNRQMNWFLVAMSVLASLMNARLFVAFTTEFYYSGFILIWLIVAYLVGGIFAAIIVIPKFFRLGVQITSGYEYFYHRFNLPVRLLVSVTYFLVTLLYMSVVLYIPALVLAQVSVLNIYWSIFLGACVCVLYTAFGGMRAVIWVDSIQILIIGIGMLALTIKGSVDAGGITAVWEKYKGIGERSNWDDIDAVPWDKYNVWNVAFLWGILMMGLDGADQVVLQRYLTVPDLRKSQRSIMVGTVIGALFLIQTAILGMVIFASVGGDEPLILKQIDKPDQIMPYFLMRSLGDYHGIPGIVVASLFAASLSSLSSGQNALAAVFLEDIVRPLYKLKTGNQLSEKKINVTSRILGIVIGAVVLLLSIAVPKFGENVLSVSLNIQSFVVGPLLGLLLVGLFMPWVESWGAFVSLLTSIAWAVMMWGGAKAYSNKIGLDIAPMFLDHYNVSIRQPEPTVEPELWDVSYTWYVFLDICVLAVVANIVSLIVHLVKKRQNKDYSVVDSFPPKQFRYTTEDFLSAIGYKKTKVEAGDNDMAVISDKTDQTSGVDNPGFENAKA